MDRYVIVEWPESQRFMDIPDFEDYSFLINDERGLDIYGSCAYFIEESWLKKALPLIKKTEEQMKYSQIKKLGNDILEIVAQVTQTTSKELKGRSRNEWLTMARELFCHYAREKGMSINNIGRIINRHHSTVLHLLKGYERDLSISLFAMANDNVGFKINDYDKGNIQ